MPFLHRFRGEDYRKGGQKAVFGCSRHSAGKVGRAELVSEGFHIFALKPARPRLITICFSSTQEVEQNRVDANGEIRSGPDHLRK